MAPKKTAQSRDKPGGDLITLKTSTKNTKPKIQPRRKRPRATPLFPADENESGSDDFTEPLANQRTLEVEQALKKKRAKSSFSKSESIGSKRPSVFASLSDDASDGHAVRQAGSKTCTSVFASEVLRKNKSVDESEDSDVMAPGMGMKAREDASPTNESSGRRVSSRIREQKATSSARAAKGKCLPESRGRAASRKSDDAADESTQPADSHRSPTRGEDVKSQSQTGSQLQLTVRAIRPKSRSKDVQDKKRQAYERVKQERISETEMAFIREEFCVHYPPPPSNMAAAGRYELANRREMTKEERDALWENELKPWSERWWSLYEKFTDLVRAEKMMKPLTSSTDVRRAECKKWAKAFRKEHGDARRQSNRGEDYSGKAASTWEGQVEGEVGVLENAGIGLCPLLEGENRMAPEKARSDTLDVVEDEGGCPRAGLDICSNVALPSAKLDISLSFDGDSRNDFQFESQSDRGLVGVSPLESQSDPGLVGVSPLRDDGHVIRHERKAGVDPIPAHANVAQNSFRSGAVSGEVERRSLAPSSIFPAKRQSRAPGAARPRFDEESTVQDHPAFLLPVHGLPRSTAYVEPMAKKAEQHEDTEFLGPLAGGTAGLKLIVPKLGTCGIGSGRIPKKKLMAGPSVVAGVAQPADHRIHRGGMKVIKTLPISSAVDAPLDPPREGAVEVPTPFPGPDLMRPSSAGALMRDVQSIPHGQTYSVPRVSSSLEWSAPEHGQCEYDPENPLLAQHDPARLPHDFSNGNA